MENFASTLRRQRQQAGYVSARAFYKAYGAAFFGCTYKAYLNIESGRSVPQPRLAIRIALGLRIQEDLARAREFITAYLQSLIGRGELANLLVRVLSSKEAAPGESSLFQKASQRSFSGLTVPLTEKQADTLCGSLEHYWSFTILSNDQSHWEVSELAKAIGFKDSKVRAVLQDLVKVGVLEKDEKGKYFSSASGKVFTFPRDKFFTPLYLPKLQNLWNATSGQRGEVLLARHLVTRASEAALRNYFPYLAHSVYGSHIYAVKEKRPDSAFFTVDVSVRKLLPL